MAAATKRYDLTLDMVELTGEARPPKNGELYVYGVLVYQAHEAPTSSVRAIVRLKSSPVTQGIHDLFKNLPPRMVLEEQEPPKPRYEV